MNTRRPFNEDYIDFLEVMKMTMSSSLASILGHEAETRRADQLAQLDAAKTAFFSNASHELRTPLTLIGGPLQDTLALVSEGDRKVKDLLTLAARNVARLASLVGSLMDFSRAILFLWLGFLSSLSKKEGTNYFIVGTRRSRVESCLGGSGQ